MNVWLIFMNIVGYLRRSQWSMRGVLFWSNLIITWGCLFWRGIRGTRMLRYRS